jgi:hypothetical protein
MFINREDDNLNLTAHGEASRTTFREDENLKLTAHGQTLKLAEQHLDFVAIESIVHTI